MKTKEELNAIKNEIDTLNKKLAELNEEELDEVTAGKGGFRPTVACRDARTCTIIDPSKCTRYVKNMFLCPRIYETLNNKLAELNEEELKQVTGGTRWPDYYGEEGYFRPTLINTALDANATDN